MGIPHPNGDPLSLINLFCRCGRCHHDPRPKGYIHVVRGNAEDAVCGSRSRTKCQGIALCRRTDLHHDGAGGYLFAVLAPDVYLLRALCKLVNDKRIFACRHCRAGIHGHSGRGCRRIYDSVVIGARLIRIEADAGPGGGDPRSNTVFEIHIVIIRISCNYLQVVAVHRLIFFKIGVVRAYSRILTCIKAALNTIVGI